MGLMDAVKNVASGAVELAKLSPAALSRAKALLTGGKPVSESDLKQLQRDMEKLYSVVKEEETTEKVLTGIYNWKVDRLTKMRNSVRVESRHLEKKLKDLNVERRAIASGFRHLSKMLTAVAGAHGSVLKTTVMDKEGLKILEGLEENLKDIHRQLVEDKAIMGEVIIQDRLISEFETFLNEQRAAEAYVIRAESA